MNSRDLIMVMSSLLSMAAGVFLPQVAEPLAAMPRLILIFMLYMIFWLWVWRRWCAKYAT